MYKALLFLSSLSLAADSLCTIEMFSVIVDFRDNQSTITVSTITNGQHSILGDLSRPLQIKTIEIIERNATIYRKFLLNKNSSMPIVETISLSGCDIVFANSYSIDERIDTAFDFEKKYFLANYIIY